MKRSYVLLMILLMLCLGTGVFLYVNPTFLEETLQTYGIALPSPLVSEDIDLSPYSENYYFQFLSDEEKVVYAKAEKACREGEAKVTLASAVEHSALTDSVRALAYDYPQYHWLNDSYTYTTTYNDKIIAVQFHFDEEDLKEVESIRSIAEELLAGMPEGTQYDQYKYIFDSIVDMATYDDSRIDESQHISSVLIDKVSVCAGYAKTYQYLCSMAGLKCVYVTGKAQSADDNSPRDHAWNLIQIDGSYYWVDVTWGDPVDPENGLSLKNYNYFCINDDLLLREHDPDDMLADISLQYPPCTDLSCNYYILNDMYFENYDIDACRNYVVQKISEGYQSIELEFADPADLDLFVNELSAGNFLAECIYQTGMYYSGASYILYSKIGAVRIELY